MVNLDKDRLSKEENWKNILFVMRWVLIVLWTVILIAMLLYVVSYGEAFMNNPCELCENTTGAICTIYGGGQ